MVYRYLIHTAARLYCDIKVHIPYKSYNLSIQRPTLSAVHNNTFHSVLFPASLKKTHTKNVPTYLSAKRSWWQIMMTTKSALFTNWWRLASLRITRTIIQVSTEKPFHWREDDVKITANHRIILCNHYSTQCPNVTNLAPTYQL